MNTHHEHTNFDAAGGEAREVVALFEVGQNFMSRQSHEVSVYDVTPQMFLSTSVYDSSWSLGGAAVYGTF